jgi:hypothetical protein
MFRITALRIPSGILKMKFIFRGGHGGGGVEYNRWKILLEEKRRLP